MDIQAAHLVRLLAGKSDPSGGGGWLPLWMHARDTAGILRHLAQNWLPEAVRHTLGLEEEILYKLVTFLGMSHDGGKMTVAFQSNILCQLPEARERLQTQLVLPDTILSTNSWKTTRTTTGAGGRRPSGGRCGRKCWITLCRKAAFRT